MTELTNRFADAFQYALELHREQRRKGSGVPYLAHLMAVSGLVLEHGGTEDQAIAALLHDAVEDQGGAPILAEIKRRFGDDVAAIVDGCSDTDVTPKPPWRARKEAYVTHVAGASPATRLVSAADKLHNSRAILRDYRRQGEAVWSRFAGGRDGTLWYYRALVGAYRSADGGDGYETLVNELDRVVGKIEQLASA